MSGLKGTCTRRRSEGPMGHTMARVKGALVRAALVLSLVALALAGTVGSAAAQ